MIHTIPLPLRAIFPEDAEKTLSDFLDGVSPTFLMQFCTAFAGFENQTLDRGQISRFFLEKWFSTPNRDFAVQKVIPAAWSFLEQIRGTVTVLNSESTLRLFEFSLQHKTHVLDFSKAELEIRILKAYLWQNEQIDHRDKNSTDSTKHLDDRVKIFAWIFTSQIPINDILNFDLKEVLIVQTYKSLKFLEYLTHDSKTNQLLTALLEKYQCTDARELLHRLLPLAILALNQKGTGYPVIELQNDENREVLQAFIRQNCIENVALPETDVDFLEIRQHPLVEQADGTYRLIFPKFLIERIFNGLLWGDLRMLNQELKVFKKFDDFRSVLGEKFTENVLLYDVLNTFLPEQGFFLTGEEIKTRGFEGGGDAYFRDQNEIILFECKDFVFNADLKRSADYLRYEAELKKKILLNERGVPKAIRQILFNVRAILEGRYFIDPDISQEAVITPVLVLGNSLFDCSGIQQVIQDWFSIELMALKEEDIDITRVRPLVTMTIDTLVFYQDFLAQKRIPFYWYLYQYIHHLYGPHQFQSQSERESWLRLTIEPFSAWLRKSVRTLVKSGDLKEAAGIPSELMSLLMGLVQ